MGHTMHLNTTPATSNSDAGASADDISLDKDILRSQIRPRRLTARSHRGEQGQQQMQELFTAHILEAVAQRVHSPGTIAAYLPTKSEPPILQALNSCPSCVPAANSPGCTGTPPLNIRSTPWESPNPKVKNRTHRHS